MSGRGRGGRGNGRGRGYGRDRGRSGRISTRTTTTERKKGECEALGYNVFDYGTKGAADQANQSWEKFCDYCGTEYDPMLATELRTGKLTVLERPKPSKEALKKHAKRVITTKAGIQGLITAMEKQAKELEEKAKTDTSAEVELALKQMEIQDQKDLLDGDIEYEPKGAEKIRLDAGEKAFQKEGKQAQ